MKILVIGSGGREHCLVWKLTQSDRVKEIFCAPGNGGTEGPAKNVNIAAADVKTLADFANEKKIDLTVVGPEVPLVKGIVDEFQRRGLKVFGPRQELALLEGSKVFAKEKMAQFSVPTADFGVFSNYQQAEQYICDKGTPIVLKADGLASGKGVFVANNKNEALEALKIITVDRKFGDSGNKLVVEQCLLGEEASVLVFSDGKNMLPLASSQDHKRIYDGDRGPNTGGMGAYSPAPVVSDVVWQKINLEILQPLTEGLAREGKKYTGVLYLGLMLTDSGPKVLEFNVRFGDPETQAILPRLKNDLAEIMIATIEGNLDRFTLSWDNRACICVVVASGGYPGEYEKGKEIHGLQQAIKVPDTFVFHAGTKRENNKYLTAGGRVLNIVSLGEDIGRAKQQAYQAAQEINFEKMYFRRDIGWRAL
ncbi:MAG: phosphoribosylamine--glycine ligase [Candidatus Omnitrophica bacterium]|nr:phosphoribosylamine--glycine ligase [Candidatus Omnitrophota bacterium]